MVASHRINPPSHASDSSADRLALAEAERVRHLGIEPEQLNPTQSHLLARELIATDRSITHIADAWGFTYAQLDRAIDLPHIRAQLDAARRLDQFRAELTGIALRADALRALSRIAELPLPDPSEPGHDERHLRARAELLRRANTTLLRESRQSTKNTTQSTPIKPAPNTPVANKPLADSTAPESPTPESPTPESPPPESPAQRDSAASAGQPTPAPPPRDLTKAAHPLNAPAPNPRAGTKPTPLQKPTKEPTNRPKTDARAAADLASKAGAMPTSSPLRTHEVATECSLAPALLILPAHPADTHRRTPSLVPD